ncbi:MAG: hypothetical protein A2889_07575 [Nitrospinae bacterium RIFCSPLOWO2_01_FULL_39_10]|nr:MAG: hypothetical protein A2889_07575 [Nitrospinae bacterium RIFCSPLOWO2_01_FULL_39_10]
MRDNIKLTTEGTESTEKIKKIEGKGRRWRDEKKLNKFLNSPFLFLSPFLLIVFLCVLCGLN